MIRPYETAVVIDGTLGEDTIAKEQSALEEFFKSHSDFERTEVWGKRALAYTIRKKRSGHYVIFFYKAEGNVPLAFEKHIKLNENILRHLTVVRDLKNDAAREAFATRKDEVRVDNKSDDDDGMDVDVDDVVRGRGRDRD